MKRVTIGIPSLDEESNILQLLKSLQSISKHTPISEIIISDDSTDRTPLIIQDFAKNSKINVKLYHHKTRRGAGEAWNEIFEKASGEIIILYDADIAVHRNCTRELVDKISESTGLCASNPTPLHCKSMAGRATIFISNWLRSIRKRQLSKYTVMGRALSIRADIAKKIEIPSDIIAIDLYLQCKVLQLGYNVTYNDRAVVFFSPPDSIKDFLSQVIRAIKGHRQLVHISDDIIEVSHKTMISEIIKNIISDPYGTLCTVACYALLPYYNGKIEATGSSEWQAARTTKKIDYESLKSYNP